jgi:hypothetical protein
MQTYGVMYTEHKQMSDKRGKFDLLKGKTKKFSP